MPHVKDPELTARVAFLAEPSLVERINQTIKPGQRGAFYRKAISAELSRIEARLARASAGADHEAREAA